MEKKTLITKESLERGAEKAVGFLRETVAEVRRRHYDDIYYEGYDKGKIALGERMCWVLISNGISPDKAKNIVNECRTGLDPVEVREYVDRAKQQYDAQKNKNNQNGGNKQKLKK